MVKIHIPVYYLAYPNSWRLAQKVGMLQPHTYILVPSILSHPEEKPLLRSILKCVKLKVDINLNDIF